MTFADRGDFQATYAAERWCEENGYSVRSMQGDEPRGLLRSEYVISKWRNLSGQERKELDGRMTGDMRHGPVWVTVTVNP